MVKFCGLVERFNGIQPQADLPPISAPFHGAFLTPTPPLPWKDPDFSSDAHPSTRRPSEAVREAIGVNGGVIEAVMSHGCVECTHLKRYRLDLVNEGMILGDDAAVAGIPRPESDDVGGTALVPAYSTYMS
jgi:hypothetical protein